MRPTCRLPANTGTATRDAVATASGGRPTAWYSRSTSAQSTASPTMRRGTPALTLSDERAPADKVRLEQIDQPIKAHLVRRVVLRRRERLPGAEEIHVDQQQPGFDAGHVERQQAHRPQSVRAAVPDNGIPHDAGVLAGHPDFITQIAGVTRARDLHPAIGDHPARDAEVFQPVDVGLGRGPEHRRRCGTLNRERGNALGHILDLDVQAGRVLANPSEVGLRGGPAEAVLVEPRYGPVVEHPAMFVAPRRVDHLTRFDSVGISRDDSIDERGRVSAGDQVFEQRRNVDEPGRVADGVVLVLVQRFVRTGRVVAGPIAIAQTLRQRKRAVVERRADGHGESIDWRGVTTVPKRGPNRFRMGWGFAFGFAAVLVSMAANGDSYSGAGITVYANPPTRPEPIGAWLLFVGCGAAAGLGAYVALAGIEISERARLRLALSWAAIGLATVAANLYLAQHPGPDWWYEGVTRSASGPAGVREQIHYRNPWMVHLALTLPIAGALGGLVQSLVTATGTVARRLASAALSMAIWSVAFLSARYVGVIAVYLLTGAFIDMVEAVGLRARFLGSVGPFLGGYLTGYLVGAIGSLAPRDPRV